MSMQPPPSGYPPQFGWQPPQPPPRKSWPARHKVWTAALVAVGVFVVLVIVGAAVGSQTPKTKINATGAGSTPATTAPASPPPPALTPGETKFVAAIRSGLGKAGYTNTATDAQIANVASQICHNMGTGATITNEVHALKQVNQWDLPSSKIVKTAVKDMCRQYLPKVLIRFSGNGILNSPPFNVTTGTVTAHFRYSGCGGGSGNFIADMTDGSDDQSIANALGSGGSQTTTLYPTDTPGQYHLEIDSECSWSIVLTSG